MNDAKGFLKLCTILPVLTLRVVMVISLLGVCPFGVLTTVRYGLRGCMKEDT